MTRITYIEHDGTRHDLDVPPGQSLMEAARNNNIPGIVAECGGVCACATCHVYVVEEWYPRTGGRNEAEEDMLEFAAERRATSRLSCQIRITQELDGLVVHLPESQM